MVLHQKDLVTRPAQKPKLLQPDCPVYLHAYVCTVTTQGLAACVQMRFINRGEQTVESLFLRVRGIDAQGNTSFEQNDITLATHAEPHSVFGEEHVFFLPRRFAEALEITVERVLFENGMIWRRMPSHLLLRAEESGWIDCECGMKNPPDAELCAFCAKPLTVCEPEDAEEAIQKPEELAEDVTEEAVEEAAEVAEEAAEDVTEVPEEAAAEPEEASVEPMTEEVLPVILPIPESIAEEISEPIVKEFSEPEADAEPIVEEIVEPEPETEIEVPVDAEPIVEESIESEPEAEPAEAVQDEPAEIPVTEAVVASPEASVYDLAQAEQIMSETAALLREIMARSAASRGESLPASEQAQEAEASEQPEPETAPRKRKTLLVIFWVFFILTLIAVGLLIYLNPNGMFDGLIQLINPEQPQ